MDYARVYKSIRSRTREICAPLKTEDYVVQPIVDVSPPKWHLGHTTWFFETFVLKPNMPGYHEFDAQFGYVFNSYYETVGARVIRTDRGNLSRPSVEDIYKYRDHVDHHMLQFLQQNPTEEVCQLLVLGFNHEQQHQELLLTDIKYILGHNPLFPPYVEREEPSEEDAPTKNMVTMAEGLYTIGYDGTGFCFDNELGVHQVHLPAYEIATHGITNREYLEFMEDGGYQRFNHWHADGWQWVNDHKIEAPMYWYKIDGDWWNYTLHGMEKVKADDLVCHVSYYEASAFAAWYGLRLPTEFEWEAAAGQLNWGERWEWTESAYLPYPGFRKAPGAIGEYNGKFMVNQMVLRGASVATSQNHSRPSYRNFFQPWLRWQFTGIRLAK